MNRSHLVLGLLFVAVGGLLAGAEVGWWDAGPLLADWWPTTIVVAGLALLLMRPRRPVGGIVVTVVGAGLLLRTLEVVESLTLLWPLLLVAVGLWLLLGRPGSPRASTSLVVGDLVAVFDDQDVRAPTGPFTGAEVTAVFADVDLDLGAASLEPGGAKLDATAVFGDVAVTVPPTWEVRVESSQVFGRVHGPAAPVAPMPDGSAAPVLRLRATAVFGDVVVRARQTAAAPAPVDTSPA